MPASTSATPIRIATCASWPQACMTPHFSPFHVRPLLRRERHVGSSSTGSASMSARSATTGPGCLPRSTPTTPVCATSCAPRRSRARAGGRRRCRGADLAVAELGVLVDDRAARRSAPARRRPRRHRSRRRVGSRQCGWRARRLLEQGPIVSGPRRPRPRRASAASARLQSRVRAGSDARRGRGRAGPGAARRGRSAWQASVEAAQRSSSLTSPRAHRR